MRKLKLVKTKKKFSKRELETQRNLLLYFMVEFAVVFKNYLKMVNMSKNKLQLELAEFFLRFNIATFLQYSDEWFKSKFDVIIKADDINNFIEEWNTYVNKELKPEYIKGIEKIKKKKPKKQLDYYQ